MWSSKESGYPSGTFSTRNRRLTSLFLDDNSARTTAFTLQFAIAATVLRANEG